MNETIRQEFRRQNVARNWVARCNGAGARPWFVYNETTREYHYSQTGDLIRYGFEGAVRQAHVLNKGELA